MIIESINISKQFNNKKALKSISLSIPKASIFGLLGPNGAGKTTFIRILTKILNADTGELLFDGRPLQMEDVYKMGYLPEERGLYKKMAVEEQLLFFASLKNTPQRKAKQAIKEWAQKFDLSQVLDKPAEELSKGMQQKVQLMAALIHEPKLLILDEPFSGFDPIHAQLLQDEIIALKEKGTSIILSSHRMETVEQLCDNIALINQGKVILSGTVNAIQKAYSKDEWLLEYETVTPVSCDLFEVQMLQSTQYKSVRIVPKQTISLNEVLTEIISKGVVIKNIKEQQASLSEIFIDAVAQNKPNENQYA